MCHEGVWPGATRGMGQEGFVCMSSKFFDVEVRGHKGLAYLSK